MTLKDARMELHKLHHNVIPMAFMELIQKQDKKFILQIKEKNLFDVSFTIDTNIYDAKSVKLGILKERKRIYDEIDKQYSIK